MKRCRMYVIALSLVFLVFAIDSLVTADARAFSELPQLRLGMVGSHVEFLQECLFEAGYLDGSSDGVFGPATRKAVMSLQKATGLDPDGIAGNATWQVLQELLIHIHVVQPGDTLWGIARQLNVTVSDLVAANGISNPDRLSVGEELVVPKGRFGGNATRIVPIRLIHWDEVDRIFPRSEKATVIDLQSGLRFQVKRLYGTHHADVEPLTKADTRTMKKAIGGKWSWLRRPIVVECGGLRIASSMNGMPHGQSSIGDNDFPGHFCIHFYGSRLHSKGRVDKEHQAAVMKALGYSQELDKTLPSR